MYIHYFINIDARTKKGKGVSVKKKVYEGTIDNKAVWLALCSSPVLCSVEKR